MTIEALGTDRAAAQETSLTGLPVRHCSPLFISTYVPTQCGLATFTHDLADAVDSAAGRPVSQVVAIQRPSGPVAYNERVVHVISGGKKAAYHEAARFCNSHPCELVSLQHEYGLYSGDWGEDILEFAQACRKPIVTTLHTMSLDPPAKAREVLRRVAALSDRVVVMAQRGIDILGSHYQVPRDKVQVIPHGVPDIPADRTNAIRHQLGIHMGPVLLTFGLLSPGKGIEYMIEALPAVVRRFPEAVYMVVGATHAVLREREGERYREQLKLRAARLGVRENVCFVDRYLSLEELVRYIAAADVYVSPYVGRDQIVSGALAYAISAGKPTVSTPYIHAEELASEGVLLLAAFRDSRSLGKQVLRLLGTPELRARLQRRAWSQGRRMLWENVGRTYYDLFRDVVAGLTHRGVAAEGIRRVSASALDV